DAAAARVGTQMPSTCDEGGRPSPFTEVATNSGDLDLARACRRGRRFVILTNGGPALVRRRIQTPSDATVLSVVQPEGEVVLGASPPARRFAQQSGGPFGRDTGGRRSRPAVDGRQRRHCPSGPAHRLSLRH